MNEQNGEVIDVTRQELYDRVWTTPMRTLAPTFGLSDVGLKKLCKRHNIPTPPVGHWAKKEFGKADPQPPLPCQLDKTDELIRVEFEPEAKPPIKPATPPLPVTDSDLVVLVQYEMDPAHKIAVPDQLRNPHLAVQRTKDAFAKKPINRTQDLVGAYSEERHAVLSMSVGKDSISRALKLMNSLLVAIEKRGFQIDCPTSRSADYYDRPDVKITILGESFVFRLREKTRMIKEDPEKSGRPSWASRTRYEPKGEFELTANRDRWGSLTWKDTKRRQLEEQLNAVIIDLLVDVERQRRYREQQKREAEERARAAELQRERERLERIEKSRRETFEALTMQWELSHKLQVFAAALREEYLRRHGAIEPGSGMALWLEWAEDYAARVDPLNETRRLPKYDVPDPGLPSRW